ncbi:cysteine desulfurase [Polluticaenibacter yanchengensis]|uniref:Cysteine desulfurase n=1 Tax=Polluticaenibacter yanchengensis TaxID=3014562 RepID=A0ABT4UGX4_9BACT|nr:cysteine desulfurase [Chitinophagaceae bacterium LY-5]
MTQTIHRFTDLDIADIRAQFPILKREVKGKPLVYFDNAATSQKPQMVIDALVDYYSNYNANIHRGIHTLAEEATAAFEATRDIVQKHINAADRSQVLFTKGTTEGINLVAQTWGRANLKAGDEVIISGMEHHSNIVPWQIVCGEKGAILKVIPVTDKGELDMEVFYGLLSERTKFVSIVHVSNALGTVNPVKDIITAAHNVGALVLVDGAQSTVHLDIDVQDLDCDFFAFSGHKMYGPTGVGALYGKADWLNEMPVYQGGGEMIKTVSFAETVYNEIPYKYEAGTPNIADVIVLKSAFEFIEQLGKSKIRAHEDELLVYGENLLLDIDGLKIIGQAASKVSLTSFVIDGIHPQDVGILLDNKGIAVRTGHHCAQPLMDRCEIPGTIRASYAVYNTKEEIDVFVDALKKAVRILR